MRESVAVALYAGLEDEADKDVPVTRIAAWSKASRLGTLLWRVKYANDAQAYKPALLIIAKRLPPALQHGFRARIAETALREWLHDACRTCGGAGELIVEPRRIVCTACEGSGKHRHSDGERQRLLRVPDASKAGKWVDRALSIITAEDVGASYMTAFHLERI